MISSQEIIALTSVVAGHALRTAVEEIEAVSAYVLDCGSPGTKEVEVVLANLAAPCQLLLALGQMLELLGLMPVREW
jgi:hypothetical protein